MSRKLFLLAFLGLSGAAFASDYSGWANYRNVTVSTSGLNLGSSVRKIPLLVRLTAAGQPDMLNNVSTQILTNGADIRVTKADGTTDLPFEIVSATTGAGGGAEIWVLADTVLQNSTSAYSMRVYWGKAGSTTASSPTSTFSTANSYQAVFHMSEASGNVTDAANGYVGTSTSTTSGTGLIGAARTFNTGTSGLADETAATNYITFAPGASDPLSTLSGPITMEAWTISSITNSGNSSPGTKQILSHRSAASVDAAWLKRTGGAGQVFAAGGDSANLNGPAVPAGEATAGNWAYVVGVWDGTNWTVYRQRTTDRWDSIPHVTSAGAGPTATTTPWFIGARSADGVGGSMSRPWRGSIDEVRISNAARDSNFIRLSFETQKASATALTVPTGSAPTIAYGGAPFSFTTGTSVGTTDTATVTGAPTSYSISPALSNGTLAFSATTGAITGTPSAGAALTAYTVTATNASGSAQTKINITVASPAAPPTISYTPTTFVDTVGKLATHTPALTGAALTACVATPTLPTGYSLGATTCVIAGTPTAAASSTVYKIKATNANGSDSVNVTLSAVIARPTISFNPSTVFDTLGKSVTHTPATTGTITGCVATPTLPAGLNIAATTCIISGTPTAAAASASYKIKATNGTGSDSANLTLSVVNTNPSVVFTPSTVIDSLGKAATHTPAITGTITNCTATPALPTGLAVTAATCVISGTPTVLSTATAYKIKATNTVGGADSTTLTLTVATIPKPTISFTPSTVIDTVNKSKVHTPATTGVIASCTVAPALPNGITINATTCVISATPTAVSTATAYKVKATNTGGSDSATLTLSVVAPSSLNPGSFVIRVNGGAKPYTFQLSAADVATTGKLTMSIQDMWGRTVWSQSINPSKENREISWNGRTSTGEKAAAGVYAVRVSVVNGDKTTNLTQKPVTFDPR